MSDELTTAVGIYPTRTLSMLHPKEIRAKSLLKFLIFICNIFDVCERLFEELVKELLQNRFTVVSGSFRASETLLAIDTSML